MFFSVIFYGRLQVCDLDGGRTDVSVTLPMANNRFSDVLLPRKATQRDIRCPILAVNHLWNRELSIKAQQNQKSYQINKIPHSLLKALLLLD